MSGYDNSYSRMIAWLKIVLPLGALGVLSTLFLMSRTIDPTLSIPFADQDISDLANKPRIGNPTFSGVAENGTAFTLSAEVAVPLPDDQPGLMVEAIRTTIQSPDGRIVNIVAGRGIVNSATEVLNFSGGVTLATSFGYRIETDTIIANMPTATIRTTGPITATGPLGRISAGLMVLQQQSDAGTYELIFQNGVTLVYEPNKIQE